jgi:hypothetical protein
LSPREVLNTLPQGENSNDFFSTTRRWSSQRTSGYGFGVVGTTLKFVLQKRGLIHAAMFSCTVRKIAGADAS